VRLLINAASARVGGGVTYIQHLLPAIQKVAPGVHIGCVLPKPTLARVESRAGNADLITYPFEDTAGVARMYFDQVTVPRLLRRGGYDALFSSTGFGTWFSPQPQVLLIRNSIYFEGSFRQYYRFMDLTLPSRIVRRWLSARSMKYAQAVIFPTAAMRDQVTALVPTGGRRIAVLPYGFDACSLNSGANPGIVIEMDRWRHEGETVLLNVSTYYVQKNLETIVRALQELARRGRRVRFVTTVDRAHTQFRAEFDDFLSLIRECDATEQVVFAGHIPREQLGPLYRAADIFLFPSFTESFGHPLVESMASETPVIAADTPVNHEICGDAAAYVPPFDAAGWADAIESVADSPTLRRDLAMIGASRVSQFSWDQHASRLIELIESLGAA
jgi:glycosyltransferase involved in cell wall biosynthesis